MGLITALSIPLMILNLLGGIVAGIWLALLGEWGTIGYGIAAFFMSSFALSIILMPSMLLAAPAAYYAERGNTFGLLCFGSLSSLYTIGVITAWCCGVLFFFVKEATQASLIPTLIWSYGVATGPWAYMASKEQQGGSGFASTIATFLAELAYAVIILLILLTSITGAQAIKTFAGFMVVGLVIQMTFAFLIQKEMNL
jgi:hypothetical protein